jgi:5-methyltetrahydrofolate--homocysteine methyltransferase
VAEPAEEIGSMLENVAQAVIEGNAAAAEEYTKAAIDAKVAPRRIIAEGLIAGMDVVGQRFRTNEMFLPEVLRSAKAMQRAMSLVKPLIASGEVISAGKVIIGTVKGDIHDIGKNLVAMMLEGAGFEVVNLGVNVTADQFVAAAQKEQADILAASALLTTAMMEMRKLVQAVEQAGLRPRVRVILGGAPITREFAREVGADGYGVDSAQAVELARSLVQENRRSAA